MHREELKNSDFKQVVCKLTWNLQVRLVQVGYLQTTCYIITNLNLNHENMYSLAWGRLRFSKDVIILCNATHLHKVNLILICHITNFLMNDDAVEWWCNETRVMLDLFLTANRKQVKLVTTFNTDQPLGKTD